MPLVHLNAYNYLQVDKAHAEWTTFHSACVNFVARLSIVKNKVMNAALF